MTEALSQILDNSNDNRVKMYAGIKCGMNLMYKFTDYIICQKVVQNSPPRYQGCQASTLLSGIARGLGFM